MKITERTWGKDARYQYNGKEQDKGMGRYNFDGRMYDERSCRWMSLDPKAAKYAGISPYVGFANNPIMFVDTDGEDIIVVIDGKNIKVTRELLKKVDKSQPQLFAVKLALELSPNITIDSDGNEFDYNQLANLLDGEASKTEDFYIVFGSKDGLFGGTFPDAHLYNKKQEANLTISKKSQSNTADEFIIDIKAFTEFAQFTWKNQEITNSIVKGAKEIIPTPIDVSSSKGKVINFFYVSNEYASIDNIPAEKNGFMSFPDSELPQNKLLNSDNYSYNLAGQIQHEVGHHWSRRNDKHPYWNHSVLFKEDIIIQNLKGNDPDADNEKELQQIYKSNTQTK